MTQEGNGHKDGVQALPPRRDLIDKPFALKIEPRATAVSRNAPQSIPDIPHYGRSKSSAQERLVDVASSGYHNCIRAH
jgi:hypothetical protein